MAYRVTSNAASLGPQRSKLDPRRAPSRHGGPRAHARVGERTLTRNAILSGVALSCLALSAAGFTLIGRDHDAGSVARYTQSHKALKIALVEPPAQAQMERATQFALAPPSAPFGPDVRVKTAAAAPKVETPKAKPAERIALVPVPRAKPKQLLAANARQNERVAEKAPELSAPIVVAAVDTNVQVADAVAPSPQPSPPRGEGEEVVASAELPNDVEVAATPDVKPETAEAPIPATFGPARQMQPTMQLTAYAPPTREQIFGSDVTGAIGNPFRELDHPTRPETPPAPPKPAPETTRAIPKPQVALVPHDYPRLPKLTKARPPTIQEKLWGPSVRLASLTPMDSARNLDSRGIPTMPYDRYTAVYVITDKKVYLPDGTVLEAHSGYGDYMDDPRFVRLRMRGATPPHVYDLRMREALFHGVEAIRMLPIGGSDEIFGRDGILAHTYLLGPRGQSHGCVSFKDYDTFLDAFKAGKINRIAVLARLD